jgi:hypothetical protein
VAASPRCWRTPPPGPSDFQPAAPVPNSSRGAEEWYGRAGLVGRLDGLELSASASGASLSALLNNLDARLDIRNVDLSIDGKSDSRPMQVVLNSATVALPAGGDMQGVFTGKLLGESFSLNVTGGGMRNILEKSRWPVDLRFVGSGARLHLTGIFSPLGTTAGPELSIRLSGDRIGTLAAWTGISPSAKMPYAINAAGSLHRNRWHLEVRQLNLGNSTLRGSIDGRLSTNQQLKTSLSVHSDSMDVAQLNTVYSTRCRRPISDRVSAAKPGRKKFRPHSGYDDISQGFPSARNGRKLGHPARFDRNTPL